MSQARNHITEWIAQGRLSAEAFGQALGAAGLRPGPGAWHAFLDRLALWLGSVFCGASLVFFLAYNWERLGRYGKFALAQALIAASLAVAWRCGLDKLAGKAALLAASIFTGALLALVGQTYQTGADTFELFAAWAVAILPWVLLARLDALWLFWLGLLNVAALLYFQTVPGPTLWLIGSERALWTGFVLNTAATAAWEWSAHRGLPWLQQRWAPRIVVAAAGVAITMLAVSTVLDFRHAPAASPAAYIGWMAAAYYLYRWRRRDVFVLAGGVLSVIVVVATLMGRVFLHHDALGASLLIAIAVIALSSLGGVWLKSVAREEVRP